MPSIIPGNRQMGLLSLDFAILVIVSLALYYLLSSGRWRRTVVIFTTAIFVASYAAEWDDVTGFSQAVASLLGLFSFASIGFFFQRRSPAVSPRTYAFMVAFLLGFFIFLKHIVPATPVLADMAALTTVGLSYILFRVLHLIADRRSGLIAEPLSVGSWFAYLFCWPVFLSGPIWRYQDYARQLRDVRQIAMERQTVFTAFSRISSGCLKIVALSEIAFSLHTRFAFSLSLEEQLLPASESMALGTMYGFAALAYLLYMYFDFSGYMDVVIGAGALFGLSVPENFNRPFSCSDVLDFWNRWHMTLSKWMQDYFFTPIMASLTRWIGTRERTPYLGACGYFATFFVIGLWHGVGVRFAFWGIGLGFLASATKLWDTWLSKIWGKKRAARIRANRLYAASLGAASVFGIAVALSCTWIAPSTLQLVDVRFAASALAIGILCAVCLSVGETLVGHLGELLHAGSGQRSHCAVIGEAVAELWVAVKWFAALGILLMRGDQMPAFVYQGF